MKYKLASVVLLLALCSCKKDTNIIDEIKNSIHDSPSEVQKLDFNKTEFKDRAEELMYIREYLNQELPFKLLREQPKKMRDAQYYYISIGKDYTLHETAVKLVDTTKATQTILVTVLQKQLTLSDTKKLLKDTDLRNQHYLSKPYANIKSDNKVGDKTQYRIEEEELKKIYPNIKSNFKEYHNERYISSDKHIKFNYRVEQILITEMKVTNESDLSTDDQYELGSVDGKFIIAGTEYCLKAEYVGEGNFEGIAYNYNSDVYAILWWSYLIDNHILVNVKTEEGSRDYNLSLTAKSTTIKNQKL